MNINSINSEEAYDSALNCIDELFDAKPNTEEYNEVALLFALVELYEQKHYPIEAPC